MDNAGNSKVMSVKQAISTFLHDGDCIALGGFTTNRKPYGLVYEIIRQRKKDLYIEGGGAGGDIDMLIGAGCVKVINNAYISNAGFSAVCRRFRHALENNEVLFEDYSLDVQTIAFHGAALGLSFVPVKNMLGCDLTDKWGISEEERKNHPKLPAKKFVIQEDPFNKGSLLCCVPTPKIDVALIHVQIASPDGTCRLIGPSFQDLDIAVAAKHTIVSCEELVTNEEIRRRPELNTLSGLCVDAIVPMTFGAHPSQCFGYYDYDCKYLLDYEKISASQEDFDKFIDEIIFNCPTREEYLNKITAEHLQTLKVPEGFNYVPGLKRR